jgi:uncharacterized protein YhaN
MKLISLHIDNFGQFNNFDYVFEDGINQIIEENGWGKSTLAAFIKVMFFGFDKEMIMLMKKGGLSLGRAAYMVEVLHLRLIISSIQYTVPLKLKIRTIPLSL